MFKVEPTSSLLGALTFEIEGNSNPESRFYSRQIRLSKDEKVIIGRGYDLSSEQPKQIIEDLKNIGFVQRKAEILIKASGLRGKDALNFVKMHKGDAILTAEQEIQLFQITYDKYDKKLTDLLYESRRRFGLIDRDEIEQYQWDVLIDFLYANELYGKILDIVVVTLLKARKQNKPRLFHVLISDVEYWMKSGLNLERSKKRAIYVQEWQRCQERQNKVKSGMADDTLLELLFQPSSILTVQGFFVDLELDELDLFLKKHPSHAYVKRDPRDDGTTFHDLILALKILYDRNTVSRVFGGSLVPNTSDVREGENLNREFYPDKEYGRKVVEKTRWENDINEASLIIAQIASGETIREVNNHLEREEGFDYPDELRRVGILPLEQIQTKKSEYSSVASLVNKSRTKVKSLTMLQTPGVSGSGGFSPTKGQKMMRKFWLLVKDYQEMDTVSTQGEYFVIPEVTLMVEAFKVGSVKGEFYEKGIEDPQDPAIILANAFTKNMDLVCKHYPVFKRIKQIYKAMKMVQWLVQRKIPIDMKMVRDFHQRDVLRSSSPQKKSAFKSPASSMSNLVQKNSARSTSSQNQSPEEYKYRISNHFNFTEASPTGMDSSDYYNTTSSPMKISMNMTGFKEVPSPMIPLRKLFTRGSGKNLSGSPIKNSSKMTSSIASSTKTLEPLPSVFFGNNAAARSRNPCVYAGVLLDMRLEKTKKPQLIQRAEDIEPTSPLKKDKSSSKNNLSGYGGNNRYERSIFAEQASTAYLEDPNHCTMKFPFQDAACAVCENFLTFSEVAHPVNKQYFCRIHHPTSCSSCFGICSDQSVSIHKRIYHLDCLRCKHCGDLLRQKLIETKEGFIHNHCMGDYLKDLCETNKLNELFNGNDPTRKIVRQRSIMKKIPRVGSLERFEVNKNAAKHVQVVLNSTESLSSIRD